MLVKWWLLAIPQYVIVAIFGSGRGVQRLGGRLGRLGIGLGRVGNWGGGLIGLLVLIAGIVLLFTGRYPRDLFRLIMGLNRWSYRVVVYATLMRDEYPPFRLDPGGRERGE